MSHSLTAGAPVSIMLTAILLIAAGETAHAAKPRGTHKSPVVATVQRYAEAVASGDAVTAGRLDFACQASLVTAAPVAARPRRPAFPPDSDPVYASCWKRLAPAHDGAVERRERGVEVLWPGKDALIFLDNLTQYVPSVFVMDRLGLSPPAGGLRVEPLDHRPLPPASFRLRTDGPTVSAPATMVRLKVLYKDPLLAPVSYAPGAYRWANTVKRPKRAIKSVTVSWVVLSGLKKLGFPGDMAVLNLPPEPGTDVTAPFVTESGGYVPDSGVWWEPADAPGVLLAAVGRAVQYPEHRDRLALLNRVLIVDPAQPEALTALSRELYQELLEAGARLHRQQVFEPALASRFSELYWTMQAQTGRLDISLGMEMAGLSQPTPADYVYRMIPVMERLAQVRPHDLENRLRVGVAYRWINDQAAAITIHEALLAEIPPEKIALRVRLLTELAWSRVAKAVWNHTYEDPDLGKGGQEAEEAFKLAEGPLEKFSAAYARAYALLFRPKRRIEDLVEPLTEARRWYELVPGASVESWRYLLGYEAFKGVIDADPTLKPLLASSRGVRREAKPRLTIAHSLSPIACLAISPLR